MGEGLVASARPVSAFDYLISARFSDRVFKPPSMSRWSTGAGVLVGLILHYIIYWEHMFVKFFHLEMQTATRLWCVEHWGASRRCRRPRRGRPPRHRAELRRGRYRWRSGRPVHCRRWVVLVDRPQSPVASSMVRRP